VGSFKKIFSGYHCLPVLLILLVIILLLVVVLLIVAAVVTVESATKDEFSHKLNMSASIE